MSYCGDYDGDIDVDMDDNYYDNYDEEYHKEEFVRWFYGKLKLDEYDMNVNDDVYDYGDED